MKRFKFRLQRILEYRNSVKKDKERELAQRNAELQTAEHRLEEIVGLQDAMLIPEKSEMTMAELSLTRDYLRYLQEALIQQRLLVLEATNAVEKARDIYIEKAVEAESLESLKKKKHGEWKTEKRREERKELDKLTVQRHRFKSLGSGGGGNEGENNG